MDYKKILIYLILIVLLAGLWLRSETSQKEFIKKADVFTSVYASSAVLAELYRNRPEHYYMTRDSIYRENGVDSVWMFDFARRLEGREENWDRIWDEIYRKVDSLATFYKTNPVRPQPPDRPSLDSLLLEE